MNLSSYLILSGFFAVFYYILKAVLKSSLEAKLKQKPGYKEWKNSSEYLKLSYEIRKTTRSINDASIRVRTNLRTIGLCQNSAENEEIDLL